MDGADLESVKLEDILRPLVAVILLSIVLLVLVQGFFSGSEMALVHADRLKLRHQAEQDIVVPKSVYQQKANTLAPIVIYPLRFFSLLFYPVIFVFSRIGRLAARLAGVQMIHRDLFSTRDQIRAVIDMADMGDEIDVFDRERIRRVVRLADITVGQLMIPVTEMVTVHEEQGMKDAICLVRKYGYFRLPV